MAYNKILTDIDPNFILYSVEKNVDGYYLKHLFELRYGDIISSTVKLTRDADEEALEIKLKSLEKFYSIADVAVNKPVICRRIFQGLSNNTSVQQKDVWSFIRDVQRQTTQSEDNGEENELTIKGVNLFYLLDNKMLRNNIYYETLETEVSETGETTTVIPDDYLYRKSSGTGWSLLQELEDIVSEVILDGLSVNGRRRIFDDNNKIKGIGGFRLTGSVEQIEEFSKECGSTDTTIYSVLDDNISAMSLKMSIPEGGEGTMDVIIGAHDNDEIKYDIDWRYTNIQPITLEETHDASNVKSAVFISTSDSQDLFYTQDVPYMFTTIDTASENSDDSSTEAQAKALIKSNLSDVDSVLIEYDALEGIPFIDYTIGDKVTYHIGNIVSNGFISKIEETIEGIDRSVDITINKIDSMRELENNDGLERDHNVPYDEGTVVLTNSKYEKATTYTKEYIDNVLNSIRK